MENPEQTMELNPQLRDQGWQVWAISSTLIAMWRSNGFPARLLISFDALGETSHRRSRIGGDKLAIECEADHLHIAAASENWFQCPDIDAVIAATRVIRDRYDDALLYGHSMGAYGALLFSGPLAATNVVAFAPQVSIDPAKAPFETRFVSHAERTHFVFDDMLASVSPTASKYIVYDPWFAIDRQHFDAVAGIPNLHAVPIPFAGHYPGKMLLEGGVLRSILVSLLLQNDSPMQRRCVIRHARRRSHRYFVECAQNMSRRGKMRLALKLVNTAYVLEPDNPSVLETYSAVLQGDSVFYGVAHAILRLILKEQPQWTQYEDILINLRNQLTYAAEPIIGRTPAPDRKQV